MMCSVALLTSLITVLPALWPQAPAMLASADTTRPRTLTPAESLRTVRAARRAQERFESFRRANLPFLDGRRGGECDLRVGRLCYWDDGEPSNEVPEPQPIARERGRLLDVLTDAARRLPGDAWVTGQRVRYLVDARRSAEAVSAAGECASPPWWCAALSGLALHVAGDYARADSAFAVALASMPSEQRCEWTDISLFLDGQSAKQYKRLPCSERSALEQRFWWLSQPLYGTAGNDARTEFLARRTMARLEEQARSAFNMSWGSDLEELLMRFGWSTWWTRDHPSSASLSATPTITGHGATPSFSFHPSDRLLAGQPVHARPDDWELRPKRAGSRYAPAYAGSFSDLRTQVAVFRRGDSALVVATYDQPIDSLFQGAETEATLALGFDESSPMTVVRRRHSDAEPGVLTAQTTWAPMLLSVELTAPRKRGAARARFGWPPEEHRRHSERLALSDILLYRADDGEVASLDDVTRRALGAPRVPTGGRVGVYWEIYGVRSAGEPLAVTLTVERVGVPWHTRAAERLGLATKVTPLEVRWQEVPKRDAGFASRAITIDLSTLPAGRYRMHLTVAAEDSGTAASDRFVELFPAR